VASETGGCALRRSQQDFGAHADGLADGQPEVFDGFAELWAMVKNSRFCQPGMVGRVERATVILDRK